MSQVYDFKTSGWLTFSMVRSHSRFCRGHTNLFPDVRLIFFKMSYLFADVTLNFLQMSCLLFFADVMVIFLQKLHLSFLQMSNSPFCRHHTHHFADVVLTFSIYHTHFFCKCHTHLLADATLTFLQTSH